MARPLTMNLICKLTKALISLFFPDLCCICGESLIEGEHFFCLVCLRKIPNTGYTNFKENPAVERFYGKVPVYRAFSYMYYNKGGVGAKIVQEIKYHHNPYLGYFMGMKAAKSLENSSFFEGIDFIVPVPLHRSKLKKRGFNQSEAIARGISFSTGIPVNENLIERKRKDPSQTKKSMYERWMNTRGTFVIKKIPKIRTLHILLVDDVLTTGSTLEACLSPLLDFPEIKVSVFTLSIA